MSTVFTRVQWSLLATTGVFAFLLIVAFSDNNVPVIPDEIGYLSISKYLWDGETLNLAVMPPYRFGQSLLLFPAFVFGGSPQGAYRLGVAISCIETAMIPAVLIGIARQFGMAIDWKVFTASFLVAIFPSYFYQNSVVWPEASLRLAFLLSILLLAVAWKSERLIYWALFIASVGCLYALHARMAGVIAAAIAMVIAAYWKERIRLLSVGLLVLLLASLIAAVFIYQRHFLELLWSGRSGDDGQIKVLLSRLLKSDGIPRLFIALTGHLWAEMASTFSLFGIGAFVAFQMSRRDPELRPVLAYSAAATLLMFGLSAVQMVAFSRLDHLIYTRYNDATSTLFVWLGILYIIGNAHAGEKARNGALAAALLIIAGTALAVLAGSYPLKGLVLPNVAYLIWTERFFSLLNLSLTQIVVLGSLLALAVGIALGSLRPVYAMLVLSIVVGLSDFTIMDNTWRGHRARQGVTARSSLEYAKIGGKIYWDKSSSHDLNIMIEQFAALDDPLLPFDISTADIELGDAVIVGKDISKDGYTCIARFFSKAKLLQRGPGPDNC